MRLFIRLCLIACYLSAPSGTFAQEDAAEFIRRANAEVLQLYNSGAYAEAIGLAVKTLEKAESQLGPEHPDALQSMNILAQLHQFGTGQYDAAEHLYRRVIDGKEHTLGPEHPETLLSVNNLARLYEDQGRYGVAEPLLRRALEGAERGLGPEDPQTLGSVNNLALLFYAQGRFADAEPLLRRALAGRERVLGLEHPDTLMSVNNLAALLQAEGRLVVAMGLHERALETRERALGPEHPDTLQSVDNLATLYQAQGRFGEAEQLLRRAVDARETVLGPEDPGTLDSINNLAFFYRTQGRFDEAAPLFRRDLKTWERMLGPNHPRTLTSVNNLALLYQAQGRYAEAEKLHRRALEANEIVFGREHPRTLTSVVNLALLHEDQGRFGEAEPLLRRAIDANESVLGPEHPDTLNSIDHLVGLYETQGRYDAAEPLLRRVLDVRERVLGSEHPQTLITTSRMAFLYEAQGRHGEAEQLYRAALEAGARGLGPDHPDTLKMRGNLAVTLVQTDRAREALREFRALDQDLATWLDIEVRTTRAAAMRRHALRLNGRYQDAAFSLALTYPSDAGTAFAADLVLHWKKRLAQEDAVLNNLSRARDPALAESIAAVRDGRTALSNIAFVEEVATQEKLRLRKELEAAEAELKAKSANYSRYEAVRAARADEVTLALPRASALVEYRFFNPYDFEASSFGATRLLAVVLTPDAPPALVDLGEAEPIIALQQAMSAADRAPAAMTFDTAAGLAYGQLIAPLFPSFGGAETLFIAPDGVLNALPFEALSDMDGNRLIERFQVHMLQTGRDLVARDRPVLGKGIVAIGGVDFGPKPAGEAVNASEAAPDAKPAEGATAALTETRSQVGGFGYLNESFAEATYIADAYAAYRSDEPEPMLLTGLEATEAALKALAAPPRVLHLATHGYYLETGSVEGEPLLQSGITLAGANRALSGEVGADGENGVLHAVEAQTLNLYGTELVVLSACDTGKGVVDYSEGLDGLPRALYVAGAKNVLVALWPIGDRTARNFMERFYEIWLSQPISDPALALSQTKLAFIASGKPAEHTAAAWAPFVLFEG